MGVLGVSKAPSSTGLVQGGQEEGRGFPKQKGITMLDQDRGDSPAAHWAILSKGLGSEIVQVWAHTHHC